MWDKVKASKAERIAEGKLIHTVEYGDIQTEVKVTATASLVNEQNLSFGQPGKITNVFVKIWDEVTAWEVLAELNMDDYHNALQTAELDVANAQLWLDKLLNNDTSLRQAQIRSQINETTSSYELGLEQFDILKKQLSTAMKQEKDQLDQMQRNYELAKKWVEFAGSWLVTDISMYANDSENAQKKRQATFWNIKSSIDTNLGDVESVIESVDTIFWVSEQYNNQAQSYKWHLSARKTSLKSETADLIRQSYVVLKEFDERADSLSVSSSDSDIYNYIQDFYNETDILLDMCDMAGNALDMTTAWSDLTEAQLQWFVATVAAARATSIGLRLKLQTLASSVSSMLLSYDTDRSSLKTQEESIATLTLEIDTLEKDQSNKINSEQAQINNLLEKKDVLEKELADILDWADSYDIQQARNMISQAQLRLDRSRDQQDDFQIIAEFDGRVRTVDIVAWEQYKLDDKKFIVVENPNLIELKLQVSQIDIVKMKVWDPVKVTFDAYPNSPIYAKVTSRNVNPEPNGRWWVYYESTIVLEKQAQEILAGMSALVTVITDESKHTLVIPTLALLQQNGKNFVQRKVWNNYELIEVQVWVMNNFQVEIVSGLKQWDVIKASVLDEDALKDMWINDNASLFGK